MTRILRFLAIPTVLLALVAAPEPVRAQSPGQEAPVEGGGGESGNPLYGYLGVGVIGALAVFILCKSARR